MIGDCAADLLSPCGREVGWRQVLSIGPVYHPRLLSTRDREVQPTSGHDRAVVADTHGNASRESIQTDQLAAPVEGLVSRAQRGETP